MKLFDAHCHLQDLRIFPQVKIAVDSANKNNIKYIAVKSTTEEDWSRVEELNNRFDIINPSFGLHPWFLALRSENWQSKLKKYLFQYPNAGVGEIGIDPDTKGDSGVDIEEQEIIFYHQLKIAKEFQRPVSIHCRSAWGRLLKILKDIGELPGGLMIHCYGGSIETAKELLKIGAYISFSGTITRLNNKKAADVIKNIPSDKILLETDAPDLLPYGIRSEINEPANLIHVLNKASEFRKQSVTLLAEQTFINTCRFFNIVN